MYDIKLSFFLSFLFYSLYSYAMHGPRAFEIAFGKDSRASQYIARNIFTRECAPAHGYFAIYSSFNKFVTPYPNKINCRRSLVVGPRARFQSAVSFRLWHNFSLARPFPLRSKDRAYEELKLKNEEKIKEYRSAHCPFSHSVASHVRYTRSFLPIRPPRSAGI